MEKKKSTNPFAIMLVLLIMKVCSIGCIAEEKKIGMVSSIASPDSALPAASYERHINFGIKRVKKRRKAV